MTKAHEDKNILLQLECESARGENGPGWHMRLSEEPHSEGSTSKSSQICRLGVSQVFASAYIFSKVGFGRDVDSKSGRGDTCEPTAVDHPKNNRRILKHGMQRDELVCERNAKRRTCVCTACKETNLSYICTGTSTSTVDCLLHHGTED